MLLVIGVIHVKSEAPKVTSLISSRAFIKLVFEGAHNIIVYLRCELMC